jgi:gamma-glutamyltranspeptidase/glutathione hydrolase
MVASSQPLASEAGMRILQRGGNAADAAVTVAAVLNVTEPTSTGIGGDCFCLFFDASSSSVKGINGSGRAPAGMTLEGLAERGVEGSMPPLSIHTITVPGAAAGWIDTLERFGSMEVGNILGPAIELADEGFPVAPMTARGWQRGAARLKSGPYGDEMLIDGRGPRAGEVMSNPTLARTFRELAEHGKAGFYEGRVADSIVDLIEPMGSFMTLEDLAIHGSTFPEPISTDYRGYEIYEIPPNGQGITALIALNIVEEFDISGMGHSSVEHLHTLIEATRLAFADTRWYIADPDVVHVPVEELISKRYAAERRGLMDPDRANVDVERGFPVAGSDTVYFCTADGEGNACSFINSNYMGFGTGLIPKGCGFTLQNRGANFSLNPEHPNCVGPGKRPYHTIIPGMALRDGEIFGPFGVMGGFMQPQGHLQVVVNMVDYGMNPQEALDAPRFCIGSGTSSGAVALEEGIPLEVMAALSRMGHVVSPRAGAYRGGFGRGQIIVRDPSTGVLCGGSDPRADGQAVAW